MRRLIFTLAVWLAPAGVFAAQAVDPALAAPRLILPGEPLGRKDAPLIESPLKGSLILPATPKLVIPKTEILAPQPMIIPAARSLTEAEAAPESLPSQDELKKLADSLAKPEEEKSQAQEAPQTLGAAFDGAQAKAYFASGPLAPGLKAEAETARSLWSFLLPRFYRPIPMAARFDRSERPHSGHHWTAEEGHVVEIAPVRADGRGEVASAFGLPGETRVQQKIERLMLMAHEYAHVIFDAVVGKKENHPPTSAYAAMTEGFAVTMERLFIERATSRPDLLGLSAKDAMDLVAIASARERWLAAVDSHYSEGVAPWRAAYREGGEEGLIAFLSALSARRLTGTPRSDPAYQLAIGDPALLGAYLGKDGALAERRGLEAFAKASRGEELTQEETQAAALVIERAGPEGRRRVFERTLWSDKNINDPSAAPAPSAKWWEKPEKPLGSVVPSFVLAKLSTSGAAELAAFLAETVTTPGGLERLFARPGPNARTTAVISGAEELPWEPSARASWTEALTRWLLGSSLPH